MAAQTSAGQAGGVRSERSSAWSTRARARARNAASVSVPTGSAAIAIVGAERRRRRLQLAALVQDFDATLRLFEARMTEPRQLDAPFVQLERRLEREVALLELLDDAFELRDRGLEVL